MKKFYFLFLMMLLPLAASADAVQIEGIYYNLNAENKTAEVTSSRSKYSGDIAIPKSVTYEDVTYSVTSIGQSAFSACRSLTSIEIPNSVTSIGQDAFYVCDGLTSITIPNGVISIENGAFHHCKGLTSITIPSTVTSIGYYVFSGCSGLTSIVVEAGNTVYDSRDNCNAIIETASNTLIRGCETTVFPNNVTSIGMYAFTGCSGLTSVTIPKSVTSIETPSFSDCNNLTSIVVESGNTVYDSRDNCNAIIETAHNYLVAGCNTTVIPNGVTHIAADAFCGCKGLTSVEIPNSVTTILGSAFRFCDGLTSVTIPNSVTYLGSEAFYGCVNLTSVKISNSLTSILVGVFHNCSSLTSVEIPNSVTSIGDLAFSSCRSLASVEIPNSVTSIGESAFFRCSGLTAVTIPNSVTSIGKDAFKYCSSLTSVTIPHSVTSIGESAFSRCSGLTSVTSLATTPPQADENAFEKFDIPLYVPKGTRDAYLAASPWNKFKEIVELGNTSDDTDVDEITIKDIGKTTWCSEYDLDFTNVAGIKAYTATGYNNITKTIWLTRVMEVPAGTGLLVKGDPGTYKIPHAEVQSYYVNMLVGNLGATISISETDGDKTNYYLSGKDGSFVSVNGSANIGKNKAYLQLPTSIFAGTRSIGISYDDEDGTTSIRDLTPALSEGEGEWYTLQGQRVAKPGKGLYIRNGKKVVIR